MIFEKRVFRSFRTGMLFLTCCFILGISSACNREGRLVAAASRGEVESQYDLALYYSSKDIPQKSKSFEWMRRAALSRYRPAMRNLAEYYVLGFGTDVDYEQAVRWYSRYFEIERNGGEVLEKAKQILAGAISRKDVIAGFQLLQMSIEFETQSNNGGSDVAVAAATEMMNNAKKVFKWLLDARNYSDAGRLLEYTENCFKEYPESFEKGTAEQLKKMRKQFVFHIENS